MFLSNPVGDLRKATLTSKSQFARHLVVLPTLTSCRHYVMPPGVTLKVCGSQHWGLWANFETKVNVERITNGMSRFLAQYFIHSTRYFVTLASHKIARRRPGMSQLQSRSIGRWKGLCSQNLVVARYFTDAIRLPRRLLINISVVDLLGHHLHSAFFFILLSTLYFRGFFALLDYIFSIWLSS